MRQDKGNDSSNPPKTTPLQDHIDTLLTALFDQALETGQDIVLERQFEADKAAYKRYRTRVISSITTQITELVHHRERMARIDELENIATGNWGHLEKDDVKEQLAELNKET